MATHNIVPASTLFYSGSFVRGVSGQLIQAGDVVYLAAGLWYRCFGYAAFTAAVSGIALNNAPGTSQPITIQTAGVVACTGDAALTEGIIYVVSGSMAGDVQPSTDLDGSTYIGIVGVSITSPVTGLRLSFNASGVQYGG